MNKAIRRTPLAMDRLRRLGDQRLATDVKRVAFVSAARRRSACVHTFCIVVTRRRYRALFICLGLKRSSLSRDASHVFVFVMPATHTASYAHVVYGSVELA